MALPERLAQPVGTTPAPPGSTPATPLQSMGSGEPCNSECTPPCNSESTPLQPEAANRKWYEAFVAAVQKQSPDSLLREKYGPKEAVEAFMHKLLAYFPPEEGEVYSHSYSLQRVKAEETAVKKPYIMHPVAFGFSTLASTKFGTGAPATPFDD